MMWAFRVTSDDLPERFEELNVGQTTVGASFECDVCLMDGDVAPHHITIEITADALTLRPEADVQVIDGLPHSEVTWLRAGETVTIKADQSVQIGAALMRFETVQSKSVAPTLPPTETTQTATRSRRYGIAKVGLIGAICLVGVTGLARTASSYSREPLPYADADVASMYESSDANTSVPIAERMTNAGVVHYAVSGAGDAIQLVVYARTTQEQADIANRLKAQGVMVQPVFVLDSRLLSALNLMLSGMKIPFEIEHVTYGDAQIVLTAETPVDLDAVKRSILADVAHLRSITLTTKDELSDSVEAFEIAGVWLGARPYLVLESGLFATVGEQISDGIIVLAIHQNGTIVLRDQGQEREIRYK